MMARDLYQRLMSNLEFANENSNNLSPAIMESLHTLGSFLSSRSSHFEILENQDDACVFLSICKSSRENLVLVFNYFLSDRPFMYNKKEVPSEFLKGMLNQLDKAVTGFRKLKEQVKSKAERKANTGSFTVNGTMPRGVSAGKTAAKKTGK